MCNYPPYLDAPKPAEDWRKQVFKAANDLYYFVTGRSIDEKDKVAFMTKYANSAGIDRDTEARR